MSETDSIDPEPSATAAALPTAQADAPLAHFLERLLPLLRARSRADEPSARRSARRRDAAPFNPAEAPTLGAAAAVERRPDEAIGHRLVILRDAVRAYRERGEPDGAPAAEAAALARLRKALRAITDQNGFVEYRSLSDADALPQSEEGSNTRSTPSGPTTG